MSVSLHELKRRRLVWQADESRSAQSAESTCLPSGFAAFDQKLGGWPSAGLVELQIPAHGIGELRLILPALAALASQDAQQGKLQAWMTDGFLLMPQGLERAFVPGTVVLNRLEAKERLWVLDTLLQSGVCSAVVCWLTQLDTAQAKRLQIAAKESGTLVFCLRYGHRSDCSLPISMRMRLEASEQGLNVDVFKRQNALCVEPFFLNFCHTAPALYMRQRVSEAHAYQNNVLAFPTHGRQQ